METRNALLPMWFDDTSFWKGQPQRPFRPKGLAIWNAPPGATVDHAIIGATLQLVVAFAPVPARFFAQGDSYEQIARLVAEGKQIPGWCTWDPISPGQVLRLLLIDASGEALGPRSGVELAVWGVSLE